jgi:hypothetical protein
LRSSLLARNAINPTLNICATVVTKFEIKPAEKRGALVAGYWKSWVQAAIAWPIAFILAVTTARSSASLAMTIVAQLMVRGLIAVLILVSRKLVYGNGDR